MRSRISPAESAGPHGLAVNGTGAADAELHLTALEVGRHDVAWRVQQAVSIAEETAYRFDAMKSRKDNSKRGLKEIVLAAAQGTPEIIEYPDSGKIAAMARTETSTGGPLFTMNRLADAVDYFDGESGR